MVRPHGDNSLSLVENQESKKLGNLKYSRQFIRGFNNIIHLESIQRSLNCMEKDCQNIDTFNFSHRGRLFSPIPIILIRSYTKKKI